MADQICPCGFTPVWASEIPPSTDCHGVTPRGQFMPTSCEFDQHRIVVVYCPEEGCDTQWDIDLTREEERQYKEWEESGCPK